MEKQKKKVIYRQLKCSKYSIPTIKIIFEDYLPKNKQNIDWEWLDFAKQLITKQYKTSDNSVLHNLLKFIHYCLRSVIQFLTKNPSIGPKKDDRKNMFDLQSLINSRLKSTITHETSQSLVQIMSNYVHFIGISIRPKNKEKYISKLLIDLDEVFDGSMDYILDTLLHSNVVIVSKMRKEDFIKDLIRKVLKKYSQLSNSSNPQRILKMALLAKIWIKLHPKKECLSSSLEVSKCIKLSKEFSKWAELNLRECKEEKGSSSNLKQLLKVLKVSSCLMILYPLNFGVNEDSESLTTSASSQVLKLKQKDSILHRKILENNQSIPPKSAVSQSFEHMDTENKEVPSKKKKDKKKNKNKDNSEKEEKMLVDAVEEKSINSKSKEVVASEKKIKKNKSKIINDNEIHNAVTEKFIDDKLKEEVVISESKIKKKKKKSKTVELLNKINDREVSSVVNESDKIIDIENRSSKNESLIPDDISQGKILKKSRKKETIIQISDTTDNTSVTSKTKLNLIDTSKSRDVTNKCSKLEISSSISKDEAKRDLCNKLGNKSVIGDHLDLNKSLSKKKCKKSEVFDLSKVMVIESMTPEDNNKLNGTNNSDFNVSFQDDVDFNSSDNLNNCDNSFNISKLNNDDLDLSKKSSKLKNRKSLGSELNFSIDSLERNSNDSVKKKKQKNIIKSSDLIGTICKSITNDCNTSVGEKSENTKHYSLPPKVKANKLEMDKVVSQTLGDEVERIKGKEHETPNKMLSEGLDNENKKLSKNKKKHFDLTENIEEEDVANCSSSTPNVFKSKKKKSKLNLSSSILIEELKEDSNRNNSSNFKVECQYLNNKTKELCPKDESDILDDSYLDSQSSSKKRKKSKKFSDSSLVKESLEEENNRSLIFKEDKIELSSDFESQFNETPLNVKKKKKSKLNSSIILTDNHENSTPCDGKKKKKKKNSKELIKDSKVSEGGFDVKNISNLNASINITKNDSNKKKKKSRDLEISDIDLSVSLPIKRTKTQSPGEKLAPSKKRRISLNLSHEFDVEEMKPNEKDQILAVDISRASEINWEKILSPPQMKDLATKLIKSAIESKVLSPEAVISYATNSTSGKKSANIKKRVTVDSSSPVSSRKKSIAEKENGIDQQEPLNEVSSSDSSDDEMVSDKLCKVVEQDQSDSSDNDVGFVNKSREISSSKVNKMDTIESKNIKAPKESNTNYLESRKSLITCSEMDSNSEVSDSDFICMEKYDKNRRINKKKAEKDMSSKSSIKTSVIVNKSKIIDSDSDIEIVEECTVAKPIVKKSKSLNQSSEIDEATGSESELINNADDNPMFTHEENQEYHEKLKEKTEKLLKDDEINIQQHLAIHYGLDVKEETCEEEKTYSEECETNKVNITPPKNVDAGSLLMNSLYKKNTDVQSNIENQSSSINNSSSNSLKNNTDKSKEINLEVESKSYGSDEFSNSNLDQSVQNKSLNKTPDLPIVNNSSLPEQDEEEGLDTILNTIMKDTGKRESIIGIKERLLEQDDSNSRDANKSTNLNTENEAISNNDRLQDLINQSEQIKGTNNSETDLITLDDDDNNDSVFNISSFIKNVRNSVTIVNVVDNDVNQETNASIIKDHNKDASIIKDDDNDVSIIDDDRNDLRIIKNENNVNVIKDIDDNDISIINDDDFISIKKDEKEEPKVKDKVDEITVLDDDEELTSIQDTGDELDTVEDNSKELAAIGDGNNVVVSVNDNKEVAVVIDDANEIADKIDYNKVAEDPKEVPALNKNDDIPVEKDNCNTVIALNKDSNVTGDKDNENEVTLVTDNYNDGTVKIDTKVESNNKDDVDSIPPTKEDVLPLDKTIPEKSAPTDDCIGLDEIKENVQPAIKNIQFPTSENVKSSIGSPSILVENNMKVDTLVTSDTPKILPNSVESSASLNGSKVQNMQDFVPNPLQNRQSSIKNSPSKKVQINEKPQETERLIENIKEKSLFKKEQKNAYSEEKDFHENTLGVCNKIKENEEILDDQGINAKNQDDEMNEDASDAETIIYSSDSEMSSIIDLTEKNQNKSPNKDIVKCKQLIDNSLSTTPEVNNESNNITEKSNNDIKESPSKKTLSDEVKDHEVSNEIFENNNKTNEIDCENKDKHNLKKLIIEKETKSIKSQSEIETQEKSPAIVETKSNNELEAEISKINVDINEKNIEECTQCLVTNKIENDEIEISKSPNMKTKRKKNVSQSKSSKVIRAEYPTQLDETEFSEASSSCNSSESVVSPVSMCIFKDENNFAEMELVSSDDESLLLSDNVREEFSKEMSMDGSSSDKDFEPEYNKNTRSRKCKKSPKPKGDAILTISPLLKGIKKSPLKKLNSRRKSSSGILLSPEISDEECELISAGNVNKSESSKSKVIPKSIGHIRSPSKPIPEEQDETVPRRKLSLKSSEISRESSSNDTNSENNAPKSSPLPKRKVKLTRSSLSMIKNKKSNDLASSKDLISDIKENEIPIHSQNNLNDNLSPIRTVSAKILSPIQKNLEESNSNIKDHQTPKKEKTTELTHSNNSLENEQSTVDLNSINNLKTGNNSRKQNAPISNEHVDSPRRSTRLGLKRNDPLGTPKKCADVVESPRKRRSSLGNSLSLNAKPLPSTPKRANKTMITSVDASKVAENYSTPTKNNKRRMSSSSIESYSSDLDNKQILTRSQSKRRSLDLVTHTPTKQDDKDKKSKKTEDGKLSCIPEDDDDFSTTSEVSHGSGSSLDSSTEFARKTRCSILN